MFSPLLLLSSSLPLQPPFYIQSIERITTRGAVYKVPGVKCVSELWVGLLGFCLFVCKFGFLKFPPPQFVSPPLRSDLCLLPYLQSEIVVCLLTR
jgi:hypothetical protein